MRLAAIPSPTQGVWYLGPFPLRAYALCIMAGIVLGIWLGERRWVERGGRPGLVLDVALWAVPFGIIGGRLYHVVTSWQPYFGAGGDPVAALYIWKGGLGIWGAVALGAVGAWIGCHRAGVRLAPFGDAIAPGIVLGQALGRWGNWFNNELYGRATDLPWGLTIHEWDTAAGRAVTDAQGRAVVLGTFQPTFLYESLWDVGTGVLLLALDRRRRFGYGRLFALYVALYTAGRFWIEALRVDPANTVLGLRLNLWTSVLVFAAAVGYLVVSARRHPGPQTDLTLPSRPLGPGATADEPPAEDGDTEHVTEGVTDLDAAEVTQSGADRTPPDDDNGQPGRAQPPQVTERS